MNPKVAVVALVAIICVHAGAQDIDVELASLAEKLSAPIKEQGKKKVAVIDFTDLEGGSTQLGKYIAEQLTIDLVMEKRSFAVMDRANLKSVLAEHALTAKGLVDPKNAKMLGQFAGVDAIILGNTIPKGATVTLTAKIITTDTAEIVGAARAEFKADETVRQLESKAAQGDASSGTGESQGKAISQEFGNLRVVVDKVRKSDHGALAIDFTFQNKSAKNSIAVALYHDNCYIRPCLLRSSLVAGDGTRFICRDDEISGIGSMRFGPATLTEVEAGAQIKASATFRPEGSASPSVTFYKLEAELVVNQAYTQKSYANYRNNPDALPPSCKLQTLFLDLPAP